MPKFKLSRQGIMLFIGCMGVFWIFGGFTWPDNSLSINQDSFNSEAGDAWLYCFVMYIVGAVSLSMVEHRIGFIEPVSIRVVYVVSGLGLMGGSLMWWYAVKSGL